ncbi:unnamed protein product [Symbiodinium sp. CCMP2456]|nr:unnamed protein product [Symbiodinium sp. CCMP2456]
MVTKTWSEVLQLKRCKACDTKWVTQRMCLRWPFSTVSAWKKRGRSWSTRRARGSLMCSRPPRS